MGGADRSSGIAHQFDHPPGQRPRADGYSLNAAAPPYAAVLAQGFASVREGPRQPAGVHRLSVEAADYPGALRELASPPACIHILGALTHPPARSVALVGSRAASPYGRAMADRLARDLVALGYAVVSGLARGIDAAAHEGALAGAGVTVAVLPSSLSQITPPQHASLAARVAERGALVSEVECGGPFGRGAFVKRNRIIAALAGVTVVVEAAAMSGALRTAEAARALGRPIMAVPGDVDRPTARGTLQMLRDGARPCGDAGDIVAALSAAFPLPPQTDPLARFTSALDQVPRTLDQLAALAAVPVAEASALLLRLQWSGVVTREPGGRWRRRATGLR
ncbi:MAG: DNA-processing protein DprA [Candidatus Eisenbacteria bacterium]